MGLNVYERGLGSINGKPSFTIEQASVAITNTGGLSWSSALGQGTSVNYAYSATAPAGAPSGGMGYSRFTEAQIATTEQALRAWSDVADITFVRIGAGTIGDAAYSNNAAMLFSNFSDPNSFNGSGAYPGSRYPTATAGNVWINQGYVGFKPPPSETLVHEIGHAIGLSHPSSYNGTPGVVLTYEAAAEHYEDSYQYSIMSYFPETKTGASWGGAWAAAPMLDDIAAAQRLYGPNLNTLTGDTVYGFNSNTDRAWYTATSPGAQLTFAAWDAGGADTFDFSGYGNNQLIDLRAGCFSNVGGLVGNVAIAQGTVIENARSGAGSDLIHGNAAGNAIFGGAGGDTIDGGTGGSNYLRGDEGDDSVVGGVDFDDINGNMGNDTASGGLGADWVVGGKDSDLLNGDDGADIVYGNLGDDTCSGDAGDDIVRGGQQNDVLRGGDGNDWLSGDRDNDTISGGAGADIFHTFAEAGVDRVLDFSRAEGDRVQLDPGNAFTTEQVGANVVITVSGQAQMILVGAQLSSLTGDWIFNG